MHLSLRFESVDSILRFFPLLIYSAILRIVFLDTFSSLFLVLLVLSSLVILFLFFFQVFLVLLILFLVLIVLLVFLLKFYLTFLIFLLFVLHVSFNFSISFEFDIFICFAENFFLNNDLHIS